MRRYIKLTIRDIAKIDMKLAVYCLKWHIDGGSVRDLVVDPLKDHFDIHLIPWDGISLSRSSLLADADISLWFQFPPPKNALAAPGRHVWQPMWDDCRRDSDVYKRQFLTQTRISGAK